MVVLCFVVRYFVSVLVLQSTGWGGGGGACCFAWFVFLVSRGDWLFLAVPRGCLWFVIVVFPDHTHLLFLTLH